MKEENICNWITRTGKKIPINKLDLDHLINIINLLHRKIKDSIYANGANKMWVEILEKEYQRREDYKTKTEKKINKLQYQIF